MKSQKWGWPGPGLCPLVPPARLWRGRLRTRGSSPPPARPPPCPAVSAAALPDCAKGWPGPGLRTPSPCFALKPWGLARPLTLPCFRAFFACGIPQPTRPAEFSVLAAAGCRGPGEGLPIYFALRRCPWLGWWWWWWCSRKGEAGPVARDSQALPRPCHLCSAQLGRAHCPPGAGPVHSAQMFVFNK